MNGATDLTRFIARDDAAADAMAAGSLRAGPGLPVASCGALPAPIAGELGRLAPGTVLALGGPAAVCDSVLDAAGTAAALRQCTADQLRMGLEELGDDGRRATLRLDNTSSRPCQLQGAPQVRLLNADGRPNPRIETRPSPSADAASPVVLGGETATSGEQPTGHVVLRLDADGCRTADLITRIRGGDAGRWSCRGSGQHGAGVLRPMLAGHH